MGADFELWVNFGGELIEKIVSHEFIFLIAHKSRAISQLHVVICYASTVKLEEGHASVAMREVFCPQAQTFSRDILHSASQIYPK